MVDETLAAAQRAGTQVAGVSESAAYIASVTGGGASPPAPAPPQPKPGPPPSIFPSAVSTNQMSAAARMPTITSSAGGGGGPAAAGFDIFTQMMDFVLRASADRRASIDQTINIGRFMIDLERVSPTRAAAMATQLGVSNDMDFKFLNAFGAGQKLSATSGGRIGSSAFPGVSLSQSLSGRDLSFLNANPNVANVVRDYAEMVGLPDIFSRSQAGLVPTSGLLQSLAV